MATIFNLSRAAAGGVPAACLAAKTDDDAWQCNFAREASDARAVFHMPAQWVRGGAGRVRRDMR